MNPLAGTWTYRSFFNLPVVEKFDELQFAEAILTLEEGLTPDILIGKLSFGATYLDMIAFTSEESGRTNVRMRATGVKDTSTEGWVYDYVGHLSVSWPDASSQRPAVVGSMIRSVPHAPKRPAGFTASFIAVNRAEPPLAYALPENVISHFAGRIHRLHHAAWHGLRNGWDAFSPARREAVFKLEWAPPRPARAYGDDLVYKSPYFTNGSGEDFLFFHRQMVVAYRDLMLAAGEKPVEWTMVPEPGDSVNTVPPGWHVAGTSGFERRLAALKSDGYYWSRMRWWDQQFKDPTYLASLTLGELGAHLEFGIHNDMHMRWSGAPRDPETNANLLFGRPSYDFSTKWDSPMYDWLGEFYASHVNPFFWRLHGWIDDRINDWFAAHQAAHPSEVAEIVKGGVRWFAIGKWVKVDSPWVWPASLGGAGVGHGGHGGHDGHAVHEGGGGETDDAKRIASLEAVLNVLYPPPRPAPTLGVESISDSLEDAAGDKAANPVFGMSDLGRS